MILRFVFLLVFSVGQLAFGQSNYTACERSEVEELVLDYGINAEKLSAFGYLAEITHEEHYFLRKAENALSHTTAVHFEDRSHKSKRIDVLKRYIDSASIYDSWGVRTENEGKVLVSLGPTFIDPGKVVHRDYRLPVASDPCMAAISEPRLVEFGKAGREGYWAELLTMKNLLWCETNGRIIRGEWELGTGEAKCFVQVYFDKNIGGLPVLTRFILPKDLNKKFERLGKRYSCDVKTKWMKLGDGYVPMRVEASVENYTTKGVLSSTMELATEYSWKSDLVNRKGEGLTVDPKVFIHNKLVSEELVGSFTSIKK